MGNAPIVLVFAGPNGSGKSTVTKGFETVLSSSRNVELLKKAKNFGYQVEITLQNFVNGTKLNNRITLTKRNE